MKLFSLILIAVLALSACTDEASSLRALESQGFTDISFTGHDMWSCGKDDTYSTGFVATNTNGQRISGTVCCGFLTKGCTIRY
jgi:hypothetical protein